MCGAVCVLDPVCGSRGNVHGEIWKLSCDSVNMASSVVPRVAVSYHREECSNSMSNFLGTRSCPVHWIEIEMNSDMVSDLART